MASMHRADARRGARADRRHDLQAPYGPKPTQKKVRHFGSHDEDVDMTSDADSDDGPPAPGAWSAYPAYYTTSSSSENSTSGNEEGSATSAPSNSSSPVTSSNRNLHPQRSNTQQAFENVTSVSNAPGASQPKDSVAVTVHASTSSQASENTQNVHESVQQQVANFLLSKGNAPLTLKEFEQIRNTLRSMVHKDGNTTQHLNSKPLEESSQTTGKTDDPSKQRANVSEADDQSSPAVTSNGLPPFRLGESDGTPPPETSDPPSADTSQLLSDEEREEAEYRARLEQRSNELRQLLNIDEIYEPGAWEELIRYKGVKCMSKGSDAFFLTHLPLVPGSFSTQKEQVDHSDQEVIDDSQTNTTEAEEEGVKKVKDPNEQGYTPEEIMVNPYERISAFKGRKRRPMSYYLKNGKQPNTSRQGQSKSTVPTEHHQDTQRGAATEGPMAAPTIGGQVAHSALGALHSLTTLNHNVPKSWVSAPTRDPPPEVSKGTTDKGRQFESLGKRKSTFLMIESEGQVLDGPNERKTKRRRPSADDNEMEVEEDENLQNVQVVGDMIDETPEPPVPPPIQVSPPKKASQRRRPSIRPPDGIRPKHFQHSPINPSPLRFMSKLTPDSPETPPAEIIPEADPQDQAGITEDGIPAYRFLGSLYRLSGVGPQRTSRAMMTAKQKAVGFKPYYLPDFLIVKGKHPHYEPLAPPDDLYRLLKHYRSKRPSPNLPVNPRDL
ncbi:11156_t:CDS:2, partial [Acaulospora colombiana]